MAIEVTVLSGSRRGQREIFEKSLIAVGRHPMSDLQFDPENDLDVSARHAEIRGIEGRYTLYDSGSTNGTFVNGRRVVRKQELADGDIVAFGEHGPQIAVKIVGALSPAAATVARQSASSHEAPPTPPRSSTSERVALAVREQTRGMQWMLAAAVVVLSALAVGAYWIGHREATVRNKQVDSLLALNEQTTREFAAKLLSMHDTAISNEAVRRNEILRQRAKESGAGHEDSTLLRDLVREQELHRALTQIDLPERVVQPNDPAVVLVASEINGVPYVSSGFSVSKAGLIVTNKHIVQEGDAKTTRLGVKFANTGEWLPARVVKVSELADEDLALIKVDVPRTYPAVAGVSRTGKDAPVGAPVATIGYPLGLDTPMDGTGNDMVIRTTVTMGTVSKRLASLLQIDSYATNGSSGSPVFDRLGRVVGVIWGGSRGSGGRIVYAVPSDRLAAFLPPEARGVLR
jgi:S1-C subfamily serine protease